MERCLACKAEAVGAVYRRYSASFRRTRDVLHDGNAGGSHDAELPYHRPRKRGSAPRLRHMLKPTGHLVIRFTNSTEEAGAEPASLSSDSLAIPTLDHRPFGRLLADFERLINRHLSG